MAEERERGKMVFMPDVCKKKVCMRARGKISIRNITIHHIAYIKYFWRKQKEITATTIKCVWNKNKQKKIPAGIGLVKKQGISSLFFFFSVFFSPNLFQVQSKVSFHVLLFSIFFFDWQHCINIWWCSHTQILYMCVVASRE